MSGVGRAHMGGEWVGSGWMYECGVESRGWGVKDGVGGWVVRDWM